MDLPPDDIAKAYAWRTNHENLRTLSPYEFVRRFEVVATTPPPRDDTATTSQSTTQWIVKPEELEIHVIPQPSVHYIVKPPTIKDDY